MKAFRAFRLDTVNHCVWHGQERLALAPKAFDVLRYLVEHSDRLVTQDEILEALWPETYVNPEVVKKYVLGIRRVLGDQSTKPEFIATFPRRGYQFIAPVSEERSLPPAPGLAGKVKTLVGRADAIAQLDRAVKDARLGLRQIVFITGEAGVGKTTLMDVFLQSGALGAETRIARGQCVEGFGGKEAYYPVLDALGHMLQNVDGDLVFQAFRKRAPTWMVQFPSLVDAEQRQTLEREIIGATRERMVREVCEALETVAAQDLVVLCLEDLHWVDLSTLDFISALARRRGPAKLLLLGTYRPADVAVSQSPLKALKQDLVIHRLAGELGLERLEPSDVAEYLRIEFAGAEFPSGFASAVYRHSGGNALFMVAILQDLLKKGLIMRSAGKWEVPASFEVDDIASSVPETLDQLIEIQFQQLEPLEQRILRSASVAGEGFSAWAISDAAELDQASIEDVCEQLADRTQFIRACGIHELSSGQISAHYEFLHSLYREVLYRRLSEVNRSKLHLQIARRLKVSCDPCEQELATELALHFEAGYDYEEAIRYLFVAAENAVGRFAYRDAIEILQHALELVARLPAGARAGHEVRIFEFIGDAHFALGALVRSAEAYEEVAARAEQAGLKVAQVRALICAMYPLGFIDPDRGLAAMDRAAQMSADLSDELLRERAQLLASCCHLVFDEWSHEHSERCATAHANLLRLGDSGTDPYQKMTYAHVLTLTGRHREALDIFEGAISRTDHALRLIPHFGALSGKTVALLRLGRLGDVLRITSAGREASDENRARAWLLSFREAWLRLLAFDRAGALAICEEISKASAKYHSGQPQTISLVAAAYSALDRCEYANAIELFAQVAAPLETTKFFLHWTWRMTAQLETANAWLLFGDTQKAREAAGISLKSALSTSDPHLQALAWELDARVALAERDLPRAHDSVDRALGIVGKFEILVAAWQVYATAWDLYRHTGDLDAAEANRLRSETCIRQIADSFDPDEPLRTTFLEAAPVRRILSGILTAELVSKAGSRMGAAC